jgi:hypothetical protein
VWLAARTRDVATLASLDGAMARLEAAPAAADADELLADVCATAAKAPAKLSAPLVARLLALLPRMPHAAAARGPAVQILNALAHGSSARLDAGAAAAVGAFVESNAAHDGIVTALRRLVRRVAIADMRAAAALAAALSPTPAAQAAAHAALAALVDDAAAFAALPAASLPDLLSALLGAERCAAAPTETRALGLRVIAALHASQHGIPSAAVASALASHASRVECGDTHDALAAHVRARAGTQLSACASLLTHGATSLHLRAGVVAALAALADDEAAFAALREPDVTALCVLLLSEPGCEGEGARLLAALASSPHGIASAAVSAAVVGFVCRVAGEQVDAAVAALVRAHAHRQTPAALALVRAAAPPRAPALFTATLAALMGVFTGNAAAFAAMPDAAMMQLAELAFSPDASSRGAGEALAAATLALPAGPAATMRFRALLAAPHVRVAASRDAGAARIVAARIAQLEAETAAAPPVLSFSQPGATFPADAAVEEFLRGHEPRRSFGDGRFVGIAAARKFAAAHFGPVRYGAVKRSYDATAETYGTGRSACVQVIKGGAAHERHVRLHAAALAELSELSALLLPPAALPAAGGAHGA